MNNTNDNYTRKVMIKSIVIMAVLVLITITAIDIIDKHNRLGTRKIPHFEYSKFK